MGRPNHRVQARQAPDAAEVFRRAAARAQNDTDVLRHLGLTQTLTETAGLPETLDKLSALAPADYAPAIAALDAALGFSAMRLRQA